MKKVSSFFKNLLSTCRPASPLLPQETFLACFPCTTTRQRGQDWRPGQAGREGAKTTARAAACLQRQEGTTASLRQGGRGGCQRTERARIYPVTTGTIPPDEPFCYQQKRTWWALFLWSSHLVPVSFATDGRGNLQPKATAYLL